MPLPLSPRTTALIEKLFLPHEQAEAKQILIEECGNNLPFCQDQDEFKMERIRFGVLRQSVGYLDELQKAVRLAKSDWRDLLVAARFADSLTAHNTWAESALKENPNPLVFLIVGLSGSGKTTVGNQLAYDLGWTFLDGDGYLALPNFTRFMHGQDIAPEDVHDWLNKLQDLIHRYVSRKQNLILACTVLQETQRKQLQVEKEVHLIYLHGTQEQLHERQTQRKLQLSNLERLAYQWARFEEPQGALVMDINNSPQEIVRAIREAFHL